MCHSLLAMLSICIFFFTIEMIETGWVFDPSVLVGQTSLPGLIKNLSFCLLFFLLHHRVQPSEVIIVGSLTRNRPVLDHLLHCVTMHWKVHVRSHCVQIKCQRYWLYECGMGTLLAVGDCGWESRTKFYYDAFSSFMEISVMGRICSAHPLNLARDWIPM